jgi:hypothetical protein
MSSSLFSSEFTNQLNILTKRQLFELVELCHVTYNMIKTSTDVKYAVSVYENFIDGIFKMDCIKKLNMDIIFAEVKKLNTITKLDICYNILTFIQMFSSVIKSSYENASDELETNINTIFLKFSDIGIY